MLDGSLLVTTLSGKPTSNGKPQVPELLLKLKRAFKALTAAWEKLKDFLCFGESCFLQIVPPTHIQYTQNPTDHCPGQPSVADPTGTGVGTGRSPEVSSKLSALWLCDQF